MASDNNYSDWAGIVISGIVGVFTGAAVLVKLVFTSGARLLKIEHKIETLDIRGIVRDELERERHDVLYPQLQVRVYAVIDKMEEELKIQGQNIAVLMERDRTSIAMERMIGDLGKAVGNAVSSAITESLKNRAS